MCMSVVLVLQSFLCSESSLKVLNFFVTSLPGILVIFDICKCVLLKLFSFIALYALSTLSPNLLSMVMFFYCNISGFCFGPISWLLQLHSHV